MPPALRLIVIRRACRTGYRWRERDIACWVALLDVERHEGAAHYVHGRARLGKLRRRVNWGLFISHGSRELLGNRGPLEADELRLEHVLLIDGD